MWGKEKSIILIKLKVFSLFQESRGTADQSSLEGALFRRQQQHMVNVISVKIKLDQLLAGHSSFFSLRVSQADEFWKSY